jgi:hypothetical protein
MDETVVTVQEYGVELETALHPTEALSPLTP